MENKDLLWHDIEIKWPHKDFIFFDKKMNIDNLNQLCLILHAASVNIININNKDDYGVYYHPNKNSLECWNCDVELDYPDYIKVKMGGKEYA